jgi:hypothetical protein
MENKTNYQQEQAKIRGRKVNAVTRMIQPDLRLLEPYRAGTIFGRQSADDNLGQKKQ